MAKEDLIWLSDRTKEEQKRIAKQGGIASGKKRREKKAMKETLETLLSMTLKEGASADIDKIQSIATLNGKNITVQEAIMLKQLQKAIKGDTKAAQFIRDTSGNKPIEGVEISGQVNPLAGMTTEDLKKMVDND